MIEKLNYQDKRLIFICVIISVVSLFITQNYYNQAFPYASIDMDFTKDDAKILAEKLLINKGDDIQNYKQASKFGHLAREKLFLEYHLSTEEAGKILNETNSYYWQNRWFIPEQKEEFSVNISTTGKLAEYEHKIDEDAPGDALSKENALQVAQLFLSGAVDSLDMENWKLESTKTKKQKNRIDHQFEWVEKSFDKNGSTHRITIRVQGSVVNYYNEWIKVPDTWDHDYQKMKSNNEILGTVSFGFLFIITSYLFISILIRTRKKDLRWKTAFIYSGILAFLFLINKINNLPLQFYAFDTKDTLISFLTGEVLMGVLLGPVVMFFFVGMLIAAAEPFYRDQYPKQISFRHILTAQGIKSRSFFNSAVIGISLTFAYFAFRTIFHLMENKMGGVTITKMPEFDKLGTIIPFVGVLLAGLKIAILRETVFRMFFIPFLQKYAKSTVFAVVISSIIWGLQHAGHGIHQPFYMHIIEISIWGLIIGWIFLKYGIITTLIWHFSIKAVPSAMILLQSSNSYYITTGFVCAGLILIPLIYAIISYRRNGGFLLSNNLVNALDTEIYEEKTEAKEEIKQAAISTTYKPLSRSRVRTGLIIGFIGIFSFIAVTINDPLSNIKKIDKSSTEASKIAENYLLRRGFDLENYRSVYAIEDVFYRQELNMDDGFFLNAIYPQNKFFEYIKETSGKAALRSYLSKPDIRINDWTIRYFKTETKREYKVWVNAKRQDNGVIYFEETLSDTAYAPSLSKQDALDLVNQFAQQQNIDLINMDLVDNSSIDKGNRIDYFFKYKANNHKNNIAEAETYYEFEVYGNHIGKFKTGIELPEVWLREFEKGQSYEIIYLFISFSLIIILLILVIRYLLKLLKDNKPNWKWALIISALIFSGQIIVLIDHFPHLLFQQYNTSQTLNFFLFFQFVIIIATVVPITIFILIPVLLVNLGWPGFNNTFKKNNRVLYLKDAFVCLFCSMGLYYFYTFIEHLLLIYHSTYFPYNMGIYSMGPFWFLTLFLDTFVWNTFSLYFYIIGIFYVYRQLTTKGWGRKLFFIIVFSLPFILPFNNTELILFIPKIIWFGCFIVLFRYFFRGNPWGYLFGIMGYFIIPDILEYFQTIQVPEYRYHLIATVLCIGLFFLYFLREAFFNPKMADQ